MPSVDFQKAATVLAGSERVVAAWVFGSSQTGQVAGGADLDVAILFAGPPTLDERCELRARLQEALGIEEIDVVTLNDASPLLAFEAISGRRLFVRNEQTCAAFASQTARQYEDEMAQCQIAAIR